MTPAKRLSALAVSMLVAVIVAAGAARAQSVALVTDISGKASLAGAAGTLAILAEIPGDSALRLEAGARVTMLFFGSGEEYQLKGPALVRLAADGPTTLEGAAPLKRLTPYGAQAKGVAIRPAGVAQATFVMRGGRTVASLKLETPANITILEASPEFRWQPAGPGARYRFELLDERGTSLHAAELEAVSLRLPDSLRLQDGATYRWDVTARAADGSRSVGSSSFSVASQELRAQVERLQPAPDSPVAERVTFAVWLEQVALRAEARRYWKALAGERPDESRLQAKGAEGSHR